MSNEDNKKPINPKKELLIKLSIQASELRESLTNSAVSEKQALFYASKPLNYYLLHHIYEINGATEFNTFKQWKEQGRTIKKGATAFAVWGQPLKASKQSEEAKPEESEADKYKYFPMCFLFSDVQLVEPETAGYERPSIKTPIQDFEVLTMDYL